MIGIIVAVVAALSLVNAADRDGIEKGAAFWGHQITHRELAIIHDNGAPPQPVRRFGYVFPGEAKQ